jgi:uncharacterized membrane protein
MRRRRTEGLRWDGFLLGFALGGFFDGILLHQILQWHHLLSALQGRDIRFQVAADGYFHALMYLIAAAGLWLLWRDGERGVRRPGLPGATLLGFGAWHLVDAVVSHWLLQIHRIRMDSPDPLLWDIGWLAAFGLVPLALGWLSLRGARGGGSLISAALATAVALGAGVAALQPAQTGFATALFAPRTPPGQAIAAVVAVGGRPAWVDPTGQVVVFDARKAERPLRLYGQGAILVSSAGLPAGCFDFTRR